MAAVSDLYREELQELLTLTFPGSGKQERAPHCWFGVEEIRQSSLFHDRIEHRQWLPPRPKGSNVRVRDGNMIRWFEFSNWQTVYSANAPNAANLAPYKYHRTWSFYYDEGSIWLYRANALQLQVGDGTGNARTDRRRVTIITDEEDNDQDPRVDDWQQLRFNQQPGLLRTSHAEARGHLRSLAFQRPDSAPLHELLPGRYHAPQAMRVAPQGYGGMNGEFHILIALIAFSVHFDLWIPAFTHSLQRGYRPHGQRNGRRGKFG